MSDPETGHPSGNDFYEPGDVIVKSCDPFFKVLRLEHKDTRCNTCFKKKDVLSKCPTCKKVKYCSEDCKIKDWKNGHNFECENKGFEKALTSIAKEDMVKLLRLHILIKSKPYIFAHKYTMPDDTQRCFHDLTYDEMEWSSDTDTIKLCLGLVNCLADELDEDKEAGIDYFTLLRGIFQSYAFPICEEGELIGHGIYMQCGKFEHSCKPTAKFSIIDAKLEVRAIVSSPRKKPPVISYLDMYLGLKKLEDTPARKKLLKEKFMYKCKCTRCHDEDTGFEGADKFDYKNFDKMREVMERLMDTPSDSTTMGWRKVSDLHKKYITELRKLLNENDEFITTYLMKFCRLAEMLNAGKKEVVNLRQETLGHIGITFGKDCKLYQEFNDSMK